MSERVVRGGLGLVCCVSMFYSSVCRTGHTMAIHNRPGLAPHAQRKGRNTLAFRLLERLLGCYTRVGKQLRLLRDGCRSRNQYSVRLWSVRKRDCAWAASTPSVYPHVMLTPCLPCFQRSPRPFQLFRARVNREGWVPRLRNTCLE